MYIHTYVCITYLFYVIGYIICISYLLLSFHFYCFLDFSYFATVDKLKKQLNVLTKLNYNAMKDLLFAKRVITNDERKMIDDRVGEEKMMYLIIDIIIPSLELYNYMKYKRFLEAMEQSDDIDLKSTAEMLGKLITPSEIDFTYIPTYVQLCS